MRYAAAYVLAVLAGNSNPDVATVSKILGSVGIDCDNTKAQKKLSSLPAAGPAIASGGAGSAAPAAADAKKPAAKEEPKKEEKKKEESDEEGDDMGFGLFD
ncbi:unnamed protein product [Rotaria magnacalcarata]